LGARNRELQAIRASLEHRVSERTRILQTATEVSRAAIAVHDVEELLLQMVDLIHSRLGLGDVGLFLLEGDGQFASLRAGTGLLVAGQGHQLEVGGDSVIGQCLALGEACTVLGPEQEGLQIEGAVTPGVRAAIALPLRSRGQLVGAMAVQSAEESVLREVDIVAMQTMADQVAGVIHNAQLFAETEAALARSDQIVRRYVQESWDRFVEMGGSVAGYQHTSRRSGPAEDAWMPSMGDAVRQKDLVTAEDGRGDVSLAIPFLSHDEVIGVLGVRRPGGGSWSDDDLALAQAVSEQVTQALETMRLFEETRQRAQREQILRRTTDLVRSQTDLDAILRVAIEEMRRVTGATHAAIRLGTETHSNLSGAEE
jgi:GAF domain-containing protein